MKQKNIQIGEVYITKVSGNLVKVKVVQERQPNFFHKRTTYIVRRLDNEKILVKPRTAAALRRAS